MHNFCSCIVSYPLGLKLTRVVTLDYCFYLFSSVQNICEILYSGQSAHTRKK